MTKAAEIIAALLARQPPPVFERRSGMVYGWGLWMRGLPERLGRVSSVAALAMVEMLAQRPRRPPAPASPALGRWTAFRSLFYQDWGPPLREERGLRWLAGSVSFGMHLLFLLLLVLVALVRVPPQPPEAGESSRVQVEFIGQESPDEQGGGQPAEPEPASAAAAATAAQSSPAPPAPTAPPVEAVAADSGEPVPSAAAAQQNLQVTEVDEPTSRFVLPPPTVRTPDLVAPTLTTPDLQVPTREVVVVEAPAVLREMVRPRVSAPQLATPDIELRQREVPTPLPSPRTIQIPTTVAQPELRSTMPAVRQAEMAAPSARPSAPAAASTDDASGAPAASAEALREADAERRQAAGAAPAASPGATAGPGSAAAPSPLRGDDLGASSRNAPGAPSASSGLFNADGSVRLPDAGSGGGAPAAGPPGSRQAQQADADRASKWLERPEYAYEPTMFDKYWVPNESLLAEWVRRSVKEVEIPIPGTSKKVKCVVSVLALGGACVLSDPNLNEQPASARPPPDIPVKRNPIPTDS